MALGTTVTVLVLTTVFSSGSGNLIEMNGETKFQEFASAEACATAANIVLSGPSAGANYMIDGIKFTPTLPTNLTDSNGQRVKVARHALCVDSGKTHYDDMYYSAK